MASPSALDDPGHASRRAKTRIAVAAVLLTIAIGGLTLLTREQPAEKTEDPVAQRQESISSEASPVPNEDPAPTQINSKDQETPLPPPVEPVEPVTAPPATTPATPVTPPPPPQVTNPQPIKNRSAPVAKGPAPTSPVPSEPLAPSKPVTAKPLAERGNKPAEPQSAASPPAQASQAAPARTAPEPKNFVVQVGVFTDMANARQLQSKLAENGIPSHTETKLQVGPFNTRAEADAAREKLKNLGIGSVVTPGR